MHLNIGPTSLAPSAPTADRLAPLAPDAAELSGPPTQSCVHHWLVSTKAEEAEGRCKHCGVSRLFRNDVRGFDWNNHAWMKARGWTNGRMGTRDPSES